MDHRDSRYFRQYFLSESVREKKTPDANNFLFDVSLSKLKSQQNGIIQPFCEVPALTAFSRPFGAQKHSDIQRVSVTG